jgi:hypothetical protein
MEPYPLKQKIMRLTKTLFMAVVMVACATSQQFNKIGAERHTREE